MQSDLFAGPISINGRASSSFLNDTAFPWPCLHQSPRIHHRQWRPLASSSAPYGGNNHYQVLGVTHSATSAEIKSAYRFLALKFHPDVSKDSQAEEAFKNILEAYETLSNQTTRNEYNQALHARGHEDRMYKDKENYSQNFTGAERINRWDELRQHIRQNSYSDDEADTEGVRGSFKKVLISAFLSLFLMKTLGPTVSLVVSCQMALLDQKLDSGYKLGYVIALVLGGRGGILLAMCLSFTSWACGKTSSSMVALAMVALWVGSHFIRYISTKMS